MDRGATGPAPALALGIDSDGLGADLERGVLEASSPMIRVAQNRPLFAAVLTGSLALHVFMLFLIHFLERASPIQPETAIEIPVELVSDPATAAKKGGQSGTEKAEAAGRPKAETKSEAKLPGVQAAKSETPSGPPVKPPQPAPAEKQAAAKPPAAQAQPPEPPKAEPPKPAAAQAQPPKPEPQGTAAETPKPTPPQPAGAQAPQPAPASAPTMAALQQQAAPAAGGQSPYGLMPDNWRAVAVPAPSADGDEEMSYKTIVFGMLELAKHYPEDARARGAHGSALIQFELNDDGTVKSVKLLRSSGDASLDVESLALVERASPFPKPPPGAQKQFAAVIEYYPAAR
jgi:colicin import membrane protein